MSIQIITGFSLNSVEPIDTRIVASGSTGRDAIPYKYQGLRVFDLSNNKPYVYVGSTWSAEGNDSQVSGLTGSIGRFTSNNSVGSSNIYQVGSNIGVGTTDPKEAFQIGGYPVAYAGQSLPLTINKGGNTVIGYNWYFTSSTQYFDSSVGSSTFGFGYSGDVFIQNKAGGPGSLIQSLYISPSGKVGIGTGFSISSQPGQSLVVNGTASATGFVGSGAGLTNISPSSISNTSQLSVGTASSSLNSNITRVPTGSGTHYLTFIGAGAWSTGSGIGAGVGNEVIRANNTDLTYVPSTKTLTVGTVSSTKLITDLGSITTPSLSFTGDSNTGIYSPGSNILSFATNGVERFRLSSGAASDFTFKSLDNTRQLGLSVYDSGYTVLNLSPSSSATLDINGYAGVVLDGTLSSKKLTAIDNTLSDTTSFVNTNGSFASSLIYFGTSKAGGTGAYFMYANANSVNTFRVFNNGNVQNQNTSYGGTSDIKLKENIVDATPKLDKLMQVRVVSYNFKEDLGYESFKQIGVIAQELENVFPGLVEETPDRDEKGEILETTTKSVKYSVFVPMLIKAIQEQQAQIEELKSQVASLINK